MTEKTAQQIAKMKEQTIGVEIEIDPYPEKWTLIRSVKSKHIYKSESARIKKQTNYQVRENSANKTKRNPLFKQKHKFQTQENDKI